MKEIEDGVPIGGKTLPLLSEFESELMMNALDAKRPPITCGLPLTDTGNAERLARLHGDRLRYCPSWKKWLLWDGTRWKADDTNRVLDLTKCVARTIAREADVEPDEKTREEIARWAKRSESMERRNAMALAATSEQELVVDHRAFDQDAMLLNCRNGTVDLRTGEVLAHDRTRLMTKVLGVEIDQKAVCPNWDAFLQRVLPDEATRTFVQRAVGYSLTGSVREQALFFAYGLGANGKSVLLTTLQSLLGPDYAIQGANELLLSKRQAAHPTELADLFGKRLVLCTEVAGHRAFDEPLVKQLTGGDRIRARRMREDHWEFEPTHKIWVSGNQRPQIRGDDHGIWRRIRVIPFLVTIPEAERDPELTSKLQAELPGILNWAVAGCIAWQQDGPGTAPEVDAATAEYRDEMDVLGEFIATRTQAEHGSRAKANALHATYKAWCTEQGHDAMSSASLGRRLTERGWKKIKSDGRYVYLDVCLLDPSTDTTAEPGTITPLSGREGRLFVEQPAKSFTTTNNGVMRTSPQTVPSSLTVPGPNHETATASAACVDSFTPSTGGFFDPPMSAIAQIAEQADQDEEQAL